MRSAAHAISARSQGGTGERFNAAQRLACVMICAPGACPLRTSPTTRPSMTHCWRRRSTSSGWKAALAGSSRSRWPLAAVILHGRFIAQARDDDLAVADLRGAMHGEDVAIAGCRPRACSAPCTRSRKSARGRNSAGSSSSSSSMLLWRQCRHAGGDAAIQRRRRARSARSEGLQQADAARDARARAR